MLVIRAVSSLLRFESAAAKMNAFSFRDIVQLYFTHSTNSKDVSSRVRNWQDAVLGFELVAEDELDAALGRDKSKRVDDSNKNKGEAKSPAQELEELEAAPAWEREELSTLDGMNAYQTHMVRRSDATVAVEGMVAGRRAWRSS